MQKLREWVDLKFITGHELNKCRESILVEAIIGYASK